MSSLRSLLLVAAAAWLCVGTLALQGEASAARRQQVHPHSGVTLDVFYESMCPYCHKFFNDTLRSFWQDSEMKPLIDLRLHPAGNLQAIPATSVSKGYFFWHPDKRDDKYVYICQHGESECLGNMIHLCAKKVLGDPERYMPLYFCMAEQTESVPEKSSYACMKELDIAPEPIRECVRSPAANEEMFDVVQADAGLDQPRNYVPWVVVNGKHLEIKDGGADLRTALCTALGPAAPASCSESLAARAPRLVQRRAAQGGRAGPGACYRNGTDLVA